LDLTLDAIEPAQGGKIVSSIEIVCNHREPCQKLSVDGLGAREDVPP
jgi:hypothetical protein